MTNGGWDDDRIDRALHAAFDRHPPSGLADHVASELRAMTAPRTPIRWAWTGAALAAVLVVAVAVGLSLADRPPKESGPPAGSSATSAGDPSPAATARTAGGLPVISVAEALAFRELENRDDELAVEGWIKPINFAALRCGPMIRDLRPLVSACGALSLRSDEGSGPETADLPLRPIGVSLEWVSDALRSDPDANPVRAVVLGHFDDRRAGFCGQPEGSIFPDTSQPPSDEVLLCRGVFVVDQFASIDGAPTDNHLLQTDMSTTWALDDAIDAIAPYADRHAILSTQVMRGLSIGSDEPALATGNMSLNSATALWVLRALNDDDRPRVDTYIVPDGVPIVFRSTHPGTGSGPFAHAFVSMSHWEHPAGSPVFVVDLDDPLGIARTVEVWDESGLVLDARPADASDPEIPGLAFDIPGQAYTFASDATPNRLRVAWEGSACQRYRLLVKRDAAVIQIWYSPILARADCGGPVPTDLTLVLRKPAHRAFVERFVEAFAPD